MENKELMEYIDKKFESLEEKLQGLIEINNRLVYENIRKTPKEENFPETQDTTKGRVESSEQLVVDIHGNGIKVTGKSTFKYRGLLKDAGGSWNGTLKGWVFPNSKTQEILGILENNEVDFTKSENIVV